MFTDGHVSCKALDAKAAKPSETRCSCCWISFPTSSLNHKASRFTKLQKQNISPQRLSPETIFRISQCANELSRHTRCFQHIHIVCTKQGSSACNHLLHHKCPRQNASLRRDKWCNGQRSSLRQPCTNAALVFRMHEFAIRLVLAPTFCLPMTANHVALRMWLIANASNGSISGCCIPRCRCS